MTIRDGPPVGDGSSLIQEWNVGRTARLATRLSEMSDGHYLIHVGDEESFEVPTEPPTIVGHPGSITGVERETLIWGTPAAVSMVQRGHLPLHAGSVDAEGRAVILAAIGSYGKTTLAAAFHSAGYRLLGDDMTCLVAHPKPAVLPGPAAIRARRDVVAGLEFVRARPLPATTNRTLRARP